MRSDPLSQPPIARIRINDARSRGNRVIVYPMKPRTPGFWLIVATVGLLALLPLQALAGMTPEEVKLFEETKARATIGDANAQYHVGVCYAAGRGTAKDFGEAAKWYRKSAEQGNAIAQLFLGLAYASGQGTKKDDVEAAKWWRKAAIQGNDAAQFNLGGSYYAGRGVPKDQNEAYAYLWLAGRTDEVARKTYANLEKSMTPEVKLRLQKRADELQKEIDANVTAQSTTQPKKTISGVTITEEKGGSFNVEAKGNLAPNKAFNGSTLDDISPENNPIDLLRRAVVIFPNNPGMAYRIFLVARMRAFFDMERVSDKSAHPAWSAVEWDGSVQRIKSWGGASTKVGIEDHAAVLAWLRKSGPPSYHPGWMIQHGMISLGMSTIKPTGPLVPDFNPLAAWSTVVEGYGKLVSDQPYWDERKRKAQAVHYPDLLEAMETRFKEELLPGTPSEGPQKELRAIRISFNLKADDLTLELLNTRDAMMAVVALANRTASAKKAGK